MKQKLIICFILIGVLMLVSAVALAQDEDEALLDDITISITGEVLFVEVDGIRELTIGGVIVAPAGAFNPSTLSNGDLVTVIGILLNDDTLFALELITDVELDDEEADDENVEDMDDEDAAEEDEDMDETDEEDGEDMEDENGDEFDEEDGDEEEPAENCVSTSHPIVVRIANEFDVSPESVVAMHCDGHGFGSIIRAFLLAEATEGDAEELLAQHKDGQGWGQIMMASGVHPSQLAPGRVIGGPPWLRGGDGDEASTTSTGPGRPGGGPPGGGPPGGGPPGGGPPGGGPPGRP